MSSSDLAAAGAHRRRPFERVHVVTVTHNSASTIESYIGGLVGSRSMLAGVTLIDNASTDDTLRRLRSEAAAADLPVEIIENDNTGFAGGYLAAAQSVAPRGVPVLCLNPDVVLAPDAIEVLLDVMNSFPAAAVVTMPLVEMSGLPDTASRRRLPDLHGSVVYSLLGRFTPSVFRYNAIEHVPPAFISDAGYRVTQLEATTGALMLVEPSFRSLDEGIFDCEYWMYGEDLQLCADARDCGRTVLMAEVAPSVHVKGVSSGRPRSTRSNVAFHDAMYLYARKNLIRHPLMLALIWAGVRMHLALSEAKAEPARRQRRQAQLVQSIEVPREALLASRSLDATRV